MKGRERVASDCKRERDVGDNPRKHFKKDCSSMRDNPRKHQKNTFKEHLSYLECILIYLMLLSLKSLWSSRTKILFNTLHILNHHLILAPLRNISFCIKIKSMTYKIVVS